MRQKTEPIEELLDKFLKGETSEAEEQALADYFAAHEEIPTEWQVYRELFHSFGTDAYDFSEEEIDAMLTPAPRVGRRRILRHWPWVAVAGAACVAWLLGVQPWRQPAADPGLTTADLLEAVTILAETAPADLHIEAERCGGRLVVRAVGKDGEVGSFLLNRSSDGAGIELVSQCMNP